MDRRWEWRYFVKDNVHGPFHREDIYFPASPSLGLKLRNGDTRWLEVKVLLEQRDNGVGLWHKLLTRDCVNASTKQLVDVEAALFAVFRVRSELPEQHLLAHKGLRVHCLKRKSNTPTGEECQCTFTVYLPGATAPALVESYHSISVELEDPDRISRHLPPLPQGARVASFPQLVTDLATQALLCRRLGS